VAPDAEKRPLTVERDSFTLTGEAAEGGTRRVGLGTGGAVPLVLLHGLTATRRYVTMGSRALERSGHTVFAYDARGHGESGAPADPSAYEYADLVDDLSAVLDEVGADRAVLVGSSMGAATAMALALDRPDRVAAMVQIGPAYAGSPHDSPQEAAAWKRLADGLERDGINGFIAASEWPPEFAESARTAARQRLERHRDLSAVVAALRVVPDSTAFEGLDRLRGVELPVLVVGSRDEGDPLHPLELAERYATLLPQAELVVEEPGKPPLAWQGASLSRAIAAFLERAVPAATSQS
jgi:3-oxoadipate enol-lactonase